MRHSTCTAKQLTDSLRNGADVPVYVNCAFNNYEIVQVVKTPTAIFLKVGEVDNETHYYTDDNQAA